MLAMFAKLLMQMLTNKDYSGLSDQESVQVVEKDMASLSSISPELKCILYESLHAQDKTLRREEDRYHYEISRQINKDNHIQGGGSEADFLEQEAFKDIMKLEQNKKDQEENEVQKVSKRKQSNPKANQKNFDQENERMGVSHEVDLLLDKIEKQTAQKQYDKGMVGFTQDVGSVKKQKDLKYLTIQGLLNHPYFI